MLRLNSSACGMPIVTSKEQYSDSLLKRDTVSSVGLIPKRLPFTKSNTAVRYFRHAISLDEHRAKFKANHWQLSPPHEHKLGTKRGEMPRSNQHHPHRHHHDGKVSSRHLEREYDDRITETDVLEVWFAGCHCGMQFILYPMLSIDEDDFPQISGADPWITTHVIV